MTDLDAALSGETPPLVTPFDEDGNVDHDALAAVVEHVESGGVDGLFPCGTTGEFASLTAAEQIAVIETVVETSSPNVPVVAGVSATAIDDAVAKAEAAAEVGADAAVLTAPYFHTPNDPAGIEAFFATVADRSPLPLVLYDIPVYVGTSLDPQTVASLAEHPDVIGVKDSSGDLDHTLDLVRETPEEFRVLLGWDTLLVPGLRMGVDGGMNAVANVVPEVFATMVDGPESERATDLSHAIADLFDVCLDVGFATASKTALVQRGVLDTDAVRPPLSTVADSDRDRIRSAVEDALDAL